MLKGPCGNRGSSRLSYTFWIKLGADVIVTGFEIRRSERKVRSMGFFYLFVTISLTVYGQLVVKWRVAKAGALPVHLLPRIRFLTALLFDPWVFTALLLAVAAAVSWMAAMTKFELSYAYPFMSLAFVLVLILSAVLFNESITVPKVLGLALVVAGIIISSRG